MNVIESCVAQIDCSTLPDGVYGIGCMSYTNCTNGQGIVINCEPDYVFDVQKGYCRPLVNPLHHHLTFQISVISMAYLFRTNIFVIYSKEITMLCGVLIVDSVDMSTE